MFNLSMKIIISFLHYHPLSSSIYPSHTFISLCSISCIHFRLLYLLLLYLFPSSLSCYPHITFFLPLFIFSMFLCRCIQSLQSISVCFICFSYTYSSTCSFLSSTYTETIQVNVARALLREVICQQLRVALFSTNATYRARIFF